MIEKIKPILQLGRLHFLAGGFFLYTMGVLLAIIQGAEFSITFFIFGYSIMLPAHLSVSLSNNYFDTEVDKFNKPVFIAGGTKILIEKPELKNLCKRIAIFLIILSISISFVFTFMYSFPISYLGFIIFGNLLGWFYTAPPVKLTYRGLGEIANMITMGFLIPGIGYWTINGNLNTFFFIFSIAFVLYGLNFMIIVETPDIEGDKKVNKKTLVTKIGLKNSYKIRIISLIFASLYFLILSYQKIYDNNINYGIIFVLSLIPLTIAIIGWIKKPFTKNFSIKNSQYNIYTFILYIFLINVYFISITYL